MLLVLLACTHHPVAPAAAPAEPVAPASTQAATEVPPPAASEVYPEASAEEAAEAALLDAYTAVRRGDIPTARGIVAALLRDSPTTQAAGYGLRLQAELDLIGRPAAPLDVERWFQGTAAIGDSPTLLIFFEAWCHHCQQEAPRIAELARRYGPQGLTVVGLTKETRGATDAMVNAFIHLQDWTFPVAKEREDTMSVAYGVEGVPAAALVKGGVVVWRGSPTVLGDEVLVAALQP